MSVLILTGPPASGKNSVATLIAGQRECCAIIDVDQVRWMLVQPHTAPWEGEEGKRQARLGVENSCLLATRFAAAGCDVLVLDFIWSFTLDIYREWLAPYKPRIVLLMPSLVETLRRNLERGWLPAHEVEMLYTEMQSFSDYDDKIDNSDVAVEELALWLARLLDSP